MHNAVPIGNATAGRVSLAIRNCVSSYYQGMDELLSAVLVPGDIFCYVGPLEVPDAFFIVGAREIPLDQRPVPTCKLGLACTAPNKVGQGLRSDLASAVVQKVMSGSLLGEIEYLWGLTATAPSYRVARTVFGNTSPGPNGQIDEFEANIFKAIGAFLGAEPESDFPFSLRKFAKYRYTSEELAAQLEAPQVPLFQELNINEPDGDRILFFCRPLADD